jgi:hypothetical protein
MVSEMRIDYGAGLISVSPGTSFPAALPSDTFAVLK